MSGRSTKKRKGGFERKHYQESWQKWWKKFDSTVQDVHYQKFQTACSLGPACEGKKKRDRYIRLTDQQRIEEGTYF